jgi:hypothetical protein
LDFQRKLSKSQRIIAIHKKIESLKQQEEKLNKKLETRLITLLKNEKAFDCDFEILYGAIYELTQKLQNIDSHNLTNENDDFRNIEMVEWKKLGAELLTKKKKQTTSKS